MLKIMEQYYLGLDLSTQKLKAVIIDDLLKIIHTEEVQFDIELPEFATHGGVVRSKNKSGAVHAPVFMWIKAFDMLMDKLTMSGIDIGKIVALSGSAQQHGSVYWQKDADKCLSQLDPSKSLHDQLTNCFTIIQSPVWMDSSTTKQCQDLEKAVGGPQKLATITGSRAYERFTAAQIRKIYEENPEAYARTGHISLISSFLCSLFCGKISPIDDSDASGMNLYDIKKREWNQLCLQACAPNLEEKLINPVDSKTCVGHVSNYYVERYGFSKSCKVVVFTGDNPSTMAGMCLGNDWLAVSLGTSDTILLTVKEPKVLLNGHILCNPIETNSYMAMLCFRNGSLTRENIRNQHANRSWEIFNDQLEMTPRGNYGNFGLYYQTREILPPLEGEYRYDENGTEVKKFPSDNIEIRAIIEGQFIARRAHTEDIGYKFTKDTKILATGGASMNKSILQVLADVFNSPIYRQELTGSSMLGAAFRAKFCTNQSENQKQCEYLDIIKPESQPILICKPHKDAETVYRPMLERYRKIIREKLL